MPQFFLDLREKALDFWRELDKSQKTRISVISAILVIAITVGIVLATRPNYQPLITNADPQDIKEMIKILEEKGVAYKVSDDRSSILVNAKDNNQAQVALIDYPKMGMTFDDAFSYIQINTTESDKKVLWQQYKTSSLISKLKMFDNVKDADVELALPEKQLFISSSKEQDRPTAYVRITPRAPLTSKQVEGIVLMVSRSVVGLDPKDVTVVDNNLNVLNTESGDPVAMQSNSQYELKMKIKRELENSVYDIFNGQFDSFDTLRVKVNPVLDFDKHKSETHGVSNPEGMTEGALISSETTKEKLENGAVNGAPGVGSNPGTENQPGYPIQNGEDSSYSKQTEKKNYEYTKSLTEQEKALGQMVPENSTMTLALWYGNRVIDESKLTQEFIDQITNDASKATGIPAKNISVNKYKIVPPAVIEKTTADTVKELINNYGFFAIMLLLVLGLMVAAIPGKKRKREPDLVPAQATSLGSGFDVSEDTQLVQDIELEERSEVKKQLEKFVKQKPDAVAQLLRNWLSDDWD